MKKDDKRGNGCACKKVDDRARFTFRLPVAVKEKLEAEAAAIGIPLNSLILHIIWSYANEDKR